MPGLNNPTALLVSKRLPSWLSPTLRNKLKMVAHYNHLAVFSPAMEASGMGLTTLSLAPECPQAGAFLATQLSRFMFWTFPFLPIYILCTSVSPAGVQSSALLPRPCGCGLDTLPRLSAPAPHPGCCHLSGWLASYYNLFSLNLSVQALGPTSPCNR